MILTITIFLAGGNLWAGDLFDQPFLTFASFSCCKADFLFQPVGVFDPKNALGMAAKLLEKHRSSINCPALTTPRERLQKFLSLSANKTCADCCAPNPKWVSLGFGVFICIKCSGIHRSLGAHISKVLSVKLDEWTTEQVDKLFDCGGNVTVNTKYEAFFPENLKKPRPDASAEERADFIRRKYELQQFSTSNNAHTETAIIPFVGSQNDGKHRHGIFRNSWRRKDESKAAKNTMGMVEFVGVIKVRVVKGTNMAIRDIVTSDPYVILNLGHQSMKTKVIRSNLNPVWNERLMLSIPDSIPPLKLLVYDKDTFTPDDFMGDAEIDIQPLVTAALAHESSTITNATLLGKCRAGEDNALVEDSVIVLVDGAVKQNLTLRLQNVERGELELELECVPLSQ